LIAAAVIIMLVATGVIGSAAAIAGVVVAVLAGVIYGVVVGGDKFNWFMAITISLLSGVVVSFALEVFGAYISGAVKAVGSFLNKRLWLKAAIKPFVLGGSVNLTSYVVTHFIEGQQFTLWGLLGNFIIGGVMGILYGKMFLPWLQEARYIALLKNYRSLVPLTQILSGKLGKFLVFNVFGGGLMGAVITLMQNYFIGEKPTWSGLVAGMISGFLASILIRFQYKNIVKIFVKVIIKDFMDNGLPEIFKNVTQKLIDIATKKNRKSKPKIQKS